MSIPNRQIGWSNESNLLWGIAKQMQQLNGILGKGGCCGGGASGCITHTDITWDALNAGNAAGTLQDCFYNVTNRPNSGTDPLYVLAEGGRVDLDNEVVRQQAAVGSLCVDSQQKDFGCFNVYAEQTQYTVEYVPGVKVIEMYCQPQACTNYTIGDTVTNVGGTSASGTIVYIAFLGGEKCTIYVQVVSGTFDSNGTITNGTIEVAYEYGDKCKDASPLAVGTEVFGVNDIIAWQSGLGPRGVITAISGSTITITPTSGSWDGVVVFVVIDKDKETICFYTLTAPIVSVSTQLNSETVCWDVMSYLGFGVYLNTLMQATDGLIYGTLNVDYCPPGRACVASGQLFSLDPVTNVTTVLFIFDDDVAYGSSPSCNVIEIAGELYGTCAGGGVYGFGTIWKWNIATKTFTKLYDIGNGILDGQNPYGGLVNVSGVLYGTCEGGGANSAGTLFSYNIGTSTFTKEADFDDVESILYPQGTLVEVNPGELWGTSYQGGDGNNGTIFKYTISSGALEIVINLDDVTNSGPNTVGGASGGVSLGSDGNVYFNTNNGGYANGGTVCQITDVATTPTLNVLYEFDYDIEGGYGDAVCPIYIDGNVYGVTNEEGGGITNSGTIYKVNVTSGLFTKLHTFDGTTDGSYPTLGQLLAIGDELFGMTNGYAPAEPPINYGQIFKYNIATDEYTNIHALNSQAQTNATIASLICASITDPAYTCHTVGGCVYIDGPAGENGYTLVLKTVVTYNWCYEIDSIDACAPTIGDTLYNDDEGVLIGTIQTVTITSTDPETVCGTLTVELADNEYAPSFVGYLVDETGCLGSLDEAIGSTLSYSVTPFAGGFEPVNLPCYYNVPFDVITEYPLSQKLTRKEIEYLVTNNLLIPGTYYRIIDVDFFLYGGTEIVIQAVAPDKFADMGMGKFYVPKYNQGLEGYGIWDTDNSYSPGDTVIWGGLVWTNLFNNTGTAPSQYNLDYGNWTIPGRIKINISSVSGTFNVDDYVYGYDNAFKGIITEVGTDYLIVQAPPSFFAYPSYETVRYVNDSDTGADAIIDSVELHTDYFSDLIYDVRWDEIKYDYAHDLITYRKDNSGNSVNQEQWEYDDWGATAYRNILGMQWGNDFDDNSYVGVGSNIVIGPGIVQLINFKGGIAINNTFNNSTLFNPIFYPTASTSFQSNSLSSAYISFLELNTNSSFSSNVLTNGSAIYSMTLSSVLFMNNTLSNCSIQLSSIVASIGRLNGNGVSATAGIGAATVIYNSASKDLLSNGVGAPILRWVNGSNVQVISTLTA